MTVRDRLSVASAVAVLLACSALEPVFDALTWVPRTLGAVLVVSLVGALARRVRLGLLGAALPLLALLAYVVVVFAGSTLAYGVLPGRSTATALHDLLTVAGDDLSQYGPPAPPTTALVLLVVGGVGLVAFAVDLLASTAGRPAVAGLPLLALFAVPSAVLPGGLGWLPFVLGAAGWLGLLLVEGRDQAQQWARPLRTSAGGSSTGVSRVGRRIGGAALGVAVLVPLLVPGLDARLLDGGEGGGGGASGGSRSIVTYNPITKLRGELNLPTPVDVLHYTTDDPDPDYLRMTTLGVYDGSGWRQDVLRGNLRDDGVDDPVPTPVGRSGAVSTRTVDASLTIDALDAYWLPVPATPKTVTVDGPWMWDPGSESVFATRSNTSAVGTYEVTSSRVLPDPAELASGSTVPAAVKPYDAPVQATAFVRRLTAQIISGQDTDYGKASAIQAFFRNPDSGFTYSEQTATGGSPDDLEDFLRERKGFCEQYASAMGAMLRLAGVPSRVAVGFTPGTAQSDGTFVVTTDQAHAWPEAWFGGAGWVRFEPTPSRGGIAPPDYSSSSNTGGAPTTTAPGASAAPTDPATAGETPAEREERRLSDAQDRGAGAVAAPSSDAGWLHSSRVLAGAGVLVLLLLSPLLLHTARRRRRWRSPTATTAWRQLEDDATDTGHVWSGSESPRATAVRLRREAALPGSAALALDRLTRAVEEARYAPERPSRVEVVLVPVQPRGGGSTALLEAPAAVEVPSLSADGATVRHALRAAHGRRQRLRTLLLPPSTLRWASSRTGSAVADLLDGVDSGLGWLAARLWRRSR